MPLRRLLGGPESIRWKWNEAAGSRVRAFLAGQAHPILKSFPKPLPVHRKSLCKTFEVTLDGRIQAIQEELQQFPNPTKTIHHKVSIRSERFVPGWPTYVAKPCPVSECYLVRWIWGVRAHQTRPCGRGRLPEEQVLIESFPKTDTDSSFVNQPEAGPVPLGNPGLQMARIQAEDLFEVKVEIINLMANLDPTTGDWQGRGAQALANSHTTTGEEPLKRLYAFKDDLLRSGVRSSTYSRLKGRIKRKRYASISSDSASERADHEISVLALASLVRERFKFLFTNGPRAFMSVVSSKALALFLLALPNLAQRLKFSLGTSCSFGKTFERGKIGLKDRLKKKTFFHGKEIGAINLVKPLIGAIRFYRLIEGEGARHLNLSSLKRGLGQFVGEKVSKRTILLQDRRLSSAPLGVNLSPTVEGTTSEFSRPLELAKKVSSLNEKGEFLLDSFVVVNECREDLFYSSIPVVSLSMASQLESTSRQVFYSTCGGKRSYIYSGRGEKASSLRASIKQRRASHPLFVSSCFARVNCHFLETNPVIKPVSVSTSFLGKRAGQSFTSSSSGCLFITVLRGSPPFGVFF
ncbi:hypothetical protein FNV43_RR19407 [Rhamnella rubrinervis]|uniref:DUF8018 domain-containing protein n=1 Tax=Rhamnella rubrinervis TaxID=2594499 RepID=A0A8K0GW86_9ROSA|nr:hypothetical protein FNV43_RR19407 [Rhamnella rubrinervis]